MKQRLENEFWTGLLFTAPWLLGFLLLVLYPMAHSIYLSFCLYDGLTTPIFVGLENFRELFHDDRFWKSLWNTLYITLLGVPIGILCSLALAFLVNQPRRGIGIYRTLIYLPCLTPAVALSVLWMWLFNPESGLINHGLACLGAGLTWASGGVIHLQRINWLNDPAWAKPALIVMGLWGAGGTMLIFLAALQDVPRGLYESIELDGAGWWAKHRHVTLPLISPVILYNVIVGLIGGFQYFTQSYVISNGTGGPQDSTLFYALYLFNNAFPYWKMGYASAMSWVLFMLTAGLSFIVFRLSARRIYFQGE